MDYSKKILIIEDEESLRNALCIKLKKNGFSTIEAKDGEEGLIIALIEHPDLILLDLSLPKMNGMVLFKKLRDDNWGKTVPVIILTNLTSDDEQRNKDITELEPTYYFMKVNKSIEEIVDAIKERLNLL